MNSTTRVNFLLVLLITASAATGCQDGWFGKECLYQCHCADSEPCEPHNGSCTSGCSSGWFGNGCQYASMSFIAADGVSGFSLEWLTDSNHTTCNFGTSQTVNLYMGTPIPLTWIRVVFDAAVLEKSVTISYQKQGSHEQLTCPDHQFATVNNMALDIACATTDVVDQLTLSGPGVAALCSLYISGGRNLALKQQTQQSTTFQKSWLAEHAVDGRLDVPGNTASQMKTCTHTEPYARESGWWSMFFSRPVNVNRFLIYNRRNSVKSECCAHRLEAFSLMTGSSNGTTSYRFKDPGGPAQDVYTVVPSSRITLPVYEVTIISSNFAEDKILTLCEVAVFGEMACSPGKFGGQCEWDCNCVNQTQCFIHSGGCPAGCALGYTGKDCWTLCEKGTFGQDCSKTCSGNCLQSQDSCHAVDGACPAGCAPGYTGRQCTEVCPRGRYGLNCEQTCNVHCAGPEHVCDPVNGTCDLGCVPGYLKPLCVDACPRSKFGADCIRTCSEFCAGNSGECDFRNGSCYHGCVPGFLPPTCHKCPPGHYGTNCGETCSEHCSGQNNACHPTSGSCDHGCKPGYLGSQCTKACPRGYHGLHCKETCSIHCAGTDKECSHEDGICYQGCEPGFAPPHCRHAFSDDELSHRSGAPRKAGGKSDTHEHFNRKDIVIVSMIATLVLITIIGFLALRRRKNVKSRSTPTKHKVWTSSVESSVVSDTSGNVGTDFSTKRYPWHWRRSSTRHVTPGAHVGESSDVTKPTPSSCQPNTYKTRRNILGQTTDLIVMSACNQIETGVLKTHSNRDDVCGALEKAQQSVSSDPSKVNNDGLHNEYVVMTSNQTMSTS